MIIKDFSDLKKLISLCKKQGIEAIKVGDFELKLSQDIQFQPQRRSKRLSAAYPTLAPGGITDDTKIETDGLTPDELLFYSVSENEQ